MCIFLESFKIVSVPSVRKASFKSWESTLIWPKKSKSTDFRCPNCKAIEGRGTKKDFVDIYFLLKKYSLKNLLDFYSQKYPDSSSFMAMKSLAYFEDAEEEPMPYMFVDVSWDEIKKSILSRL